MKMVELKRLLSVIERNEYRRFAIVLAAGVVSGLFEVIGVASLVPTILLLSGSESFSAVDRLTAAMSFCLSRQLSLQDLAQAGLLVFAASSAISYGSQLLMTLYANAISKQLSTRFAIALIATPFEIHSAVDRKQLLNSLLEDPGKFSAFVMVPIIQIASRLSVLTMTLLLVLITAAHISSFIVVGMLLLYGSFSIAISPLIRSAGVRANEASSRRFSLAVEITNGIRDLKTYGSGGKYVDLYTSASSTYFKEFSRASVVNAAPRHIVEALLALSLLALLSSAYSSDASVFDRKELFGYASTFVLAGYRALPSLQGVFSSYSQLQFGVAHLGKFVDLLLLFERAARQEKKSSFNETLISVCISNARFSFPKAATSSVHIESMELRQGHSYAFVGPSGSGKTTAADMIAGLLRPQMGVVWWNEADLSYISEQNALRRVSYVSQFPTIFEGSAIENLTVGKNSSADDAEVEAVLEKVRLGHFVRTGRHLQNVGENGRFLSGGERQRIGLARALLSKSDIYIFDEATNAVDASMSRTIFDVLVQQCAGAILIVITHDEAIAQNCDFVFEFREGTVVPRRLRCAMGSEANGAE